MAAPHPGSARLRSFGTTTDIVDVAGLRLLREDGADEKDEAQGKRVVTTAGLPTRCSIPLTRLLIGNVETSDRVVDELRFEQEIHEDLADEVDAFPHGVFVGVSLDPQDQ